MRRLVPLTRTHLPLNMEVLQSAPEKARSSQGLRLGVSPPLTGAFMRKPESTLMQPKCSGEHGPVGTPCAQDGHNCAS